MPLFFDELPKLAPGGRYRPVLTVDGVALTRRLREAAKLSQSVPGVVEKEVRPKR